MRKQKLYLGVSKPGQKKIVTADSVRMDLIDREEAIERFSQLIETIYDEYEEREGTKYESDDDSQERG